MMTNDTAVRALSNDEINSVSGGADDNGIVVCSEITKFTIFGVTFHFQSCPYVTRD